MHYQTYNILRPKASEIRNYFKKLFEPCSSSGVYTGFQPGVEFRTGLKPGVHPNTDYRINTTGSVST
jgi:hypothetical protein